MEPQTVVHQGAPPFLIEGKLRQIEQIGKRTVQGKSRKVAPGCTDDQIVRVIVRENTGTHRIRAIIRFLHIVDGQIVALLHHGIACPQRIVDHFPCLFFSRNVGVQFRGRIGIQNGVYAAGIIMCSQFVQSIRLRRFRFCRFLRCGFGLCRIVACFRLRRAAAAGYRRSKQHRTKQQTECVFHRTFQWLPQLSHFKMRVFFQRKASAKGDC